MTLTDIRTVLARAQVLRRSGDSQRAAAMVAGALRQLESETSSRERDFLSAAGLEELGLIALAAGDTGQAENCFLQADFIAARMGDLDMRSHTQLHLTRCAAQRGDDWQTEIRGFLLLVVAKAISDLHLEAQALYYICKGCLGADGRPDLDLARAAVSTARAVGEPHLEVRGLYMLTISLSLAGEIAEAAKMAAVTAKRLDALGPPGLATEAHDLLDCLTNPERLIQRALQEAADGEVALARVLLAEAERNARTADAETQERVARYAGAFTDSRVLLADAYAYLSGGAYESCIGVLNAWNSVVEYGGGSQTSMSLVTLANIVAVQANDNGDLLLAVRILDEVMPLACEKNYRDAYELVFVGDHAARIGARRGARAAYEEARKCAAGDLNLEAQHGATEALLDLGVDEEGSFGLAADLVRLARQMDGADRLAASLSRYGQMAIALGERKVARAALSEARDLLEEFPRDRFPDTRAAVDLGLASLEEDRSDVSLAHLLADAQEHISRLPAGDARRMAAAVHADLTTDESDRSGAARELFDALFEHSKKNEHAAVLELTSSVKSEHLHVLTWLRFIQAGAYQGLGDLKEATRCLSEARQHAATLGEPQWEIVVLGALSEVSRQSGAWDLAEQCVSESLELARSLHHDLDSPKHPLMPGMLDTKRLLADALDEAGLLAYRLDAVKDAKSLFEEALALACEVGWAIGEAHIRTHLGNLARDCGDYDESREQLDRATALARVHDRPLLGVALESLARTCEVIGEQARASTLLREASIVYREEGSFRSAAMAARSEALLHARSDDHVSCRRMAERARADFRRVADLAGEVECIAMMVQAEMALGNHTSARSLAMEGVAIAKNKGQALTEALARFNFAQLLGVDRFSDARREYDRCRELFLEADFPKGAAQASVEHSKIEIEAGNFSLALEKVVDGIRTLEPLRLRQAAAVTRFGLYAESSSAYTLGLTLAAIEEDGEAALEIAEMARGDTLASLVRRGSEALTGPVRDIVTKIERIERRALDAESGFLPSGEARSVGERGELYEQLAQTLGSRDFMGVFSPQPPNRDALLAAVRKANVHVLMLNFEPEGADGGPKVHRLWVRPDATSRIDVPVRLSATAYESLETLAGGNRESIIRLFRSGAIEGDLSDLLPPSLSDYLQTVDEERPVSLAIVPSGRLWAIPYAALRLPDGSLVNDRAVVSLIPSLAFLNATGSSKGKGATAYWIDGMSGAYEEERSLRDHCQPVSIAQDARELLENLRVGGLALAVLGVHGDADFGLAHGAHLDKQRTSRLTAAQLLSYSLPRYLVLGSCWSGRVSDAPGSEPIGLPTIALTRGADGVLAGLQEIPSLRSGRLLGRTYELLFKNNFSMSRSLREAQRELRADPRANAWSWSNLVVFRGWSVPA